MESKDFFKHCQLQGVIVVVERLMTRLEEGEVGACLVSQLLGYGQMGQERGGPPLSQRDRERPGHYGVVEVVVRIVLTLPDRCRVGAWLEDAQEQVDSVLLLGVRHCVGVVALHCLHDVVPLARPR